MNFSEFMEWGFLGLISSGVYILWLMKESLSTLNTKIEVLVTQHENARQDLSDHESRIRVLERSQ